MYMNLTVNFNSRSRVFPNIVNFSFDKKSNTFLFSYIDFDGDFRENSGFDLSEVLSFSFFSSDKRLTRK